jgi:endonuclease-3
MPTPTKKPSTTKSIEAIYDSLSRHYGTVLWEPRYDGISELIFTVLTQHTSDRNAEKAFQQLVDYFGIASSNDWIKVLNADVEKIKPLIRSGGLSNIKAKRIKDILSQLFQTYDSFDLSFLAELPLPEAKKKLNELPGVGPKTTAVVLSFAFGMPAFPVDTHIYRVTKRLGLIPEQISADEAHDELEKIIEPDLVFPMHVYLITHGRQICKARKPLCNACPIESQCPSSTNVPRTQSSDLASVVQW